MRPGAMGGKNWSPVSYNPGTGLVYANTLLFGMHYKPVAAEFRAGLTYWGADIDWVWPDGPRGFLARAVGAGHNEKCCKCVRQRFFLPPTTKHLPPSFRRPPCLKHPPPSVP